MKKSIFFAMALMISSLAFTSCEDDSTDGVTFITYYPELTLEGDATMYVDKGSTYTEPGYTATLNGEDVTDQVVVSGTVDPSTSGIYTITYTITNEDGFSSSATRTIVVLDPNDEVEGIYDTDENSYRLYSGNQVVYGGNYEILVIGEGGGYYYVDDLLGGWYRDRAGYGDNYAMTGYIIVNDDYSIDLYSSYVSGWGDSAEFMSDGKFDPETGTLSWMIEYTTYPMDFYVTMYKR